MYEIGQYVEVRCQHGTEICRIRDIKGRMIYATRADGFSWLGSFFYVSSI